MRLEKLLLGIGMPLNPTQDTVEWVPVMVPRSSMSGSNEYKYQVKLLNILTLCESRER